MKLLETDDPRYLRVEFDEMIERTQLEISFTRKLRNRFALRKAPRWRGEKCYLKTGNKIPTGLWAEVKGVCKRYGYRFIPPDWKRIYRAVNYKYVEAFIIKATIKYCPTHIKPRDDQFLAVQKLLVYKNCLADLGTGAGKTYMIYMFSLFEIYHKSADKILIVCQDADAVLQYWDNFTDYTGKWRVNVKVGLIYGGGKIKNDINDYKIIIGNFQALQHRPPEMFSVFTHLIVDEVHRATNNTIQNIVKWCNNASYRVGLSGSILEDKSIEHYTLLETFGPIVARITQKELMDKGAATPVKIEIFILHHPHSEDKDRLAILKHRLKQQESGNKMAKDMEKVEHIELYHLEQNIIRMNKKRQEWIAKLISKLVGNILVLFIDKKHDFGKSLMHQTKLVCPEKEMYYIDGGVDTNTRSIFQKRMEEGSNKVMFATYNTYGTGKSINNIHYIILAESIKGFNIVTQVFGRGMRKHETKEFYTVFDLCDDLSNDLDIDGQGYRYQSIHMKHGDTRIRYYIKSGFEYNVRNVNL